MKITSKTIIFIMMVLLVFFMGCNDNSSDTNTPQPSSGEFENAQSDSEVEQLPQEISSDKMKIENVTQTIGATFIDGIEFVDSNNAYIIASNKDNTQDDTMEHIIAHCTIDTGRLNVVYRGYEGRPSYKNFSADKLEDGTHVIFTEKVLLYIQDNNVEAIPLHEHYAKEPYYNIKTNRLSYVNPESLNLHLLDLLYETDMILFDVSGMENKVVQVPKLNAQGTAILFQQSNSAIYGHEKLIAVDLSGNILADINLDFVVGELQHFWTNDGFAIAYHYEDIPLTIVHYNMQGEIINKTSFDITLNSQINNVNNDHNTILVQDSNTASLYLIDLTSLTS